MDSIHLQGSEEVRRAASAMNEAAQKMQQAAGSMEYALLQNQRFLDDWLNRLQSVLEARKEGL